MHGFNHKFKKKKKVAQFVWEFSINLNKTLKNTGATKWLIGSEWLPQSLSLIPRITRWKQTADFASVLWVRGSCLLHGCTASLVSLFTHFSSSFLFFAFVCVWMFLPARMYVCAFPVLELSAGVGSWKLTQVGSESSQCSLTRNHRAAVHALTWLLSTFLLHFSLRRSVFFKKINK